MVLAVAVPCNLVAKVMKLAVRLQNNTVVIELEASAKSRLLNNRLMYI